MCFNEKVSFATLGIGTILNAIIITYFRSRLATSAALIWQFVLFMQLFEGITWIGMKKNKLKLQEIGMKGAYVSNVLQPVVAFLVIALLTKQPSWYIAIITSLVLAYLSYLLFVKNVNLKINKEKNCKHLVYQWW